MYARKLRVPQRFVFLFILVLALSVAPTSFFIAAQDVTPTLTETPTLPSETPTVVVTDTPVTVPTDLPTETATIVLPTETASVTAVDTLTVVPPTATSTVQAFPTETPLALLLSDTFDNGDTLQWFLGVGWSVVPSETGNALQVFNSPLAAVVNTLDRLNIVAQGRFQTMGGTIELRVRESVAGYYAVTLAPDGTVNLYRGQTLMQTATVAPSIVGQWQTLRLSALDSIVRVAVDSVEVIVNVDAAPLPAGRVSIQATFPFATPEVTPVLPSNTLLVDDIQLWIPTTEIVAAPTSTSSELQITPTIDFPTTTPIATSVPLALTFTDNFDLGAPYTWTLGAEWGFVPNESGQALQVANSTEPLTFVHDIDTDLAAQIRFQLDSGVLRFNIRQSTVATYSVTFDTNGQVQIYRGASVIGSATVNASTTGQWRVLYVEFVANVLRVKVDGIEAISATDAAPLPPGTISIAQVGSGTLLIDDFTLWTDNDTVSALPTPTPTATEIEMSYIFSNTFDDGIQGLYTPGGWGVFDYEGNAIFKAFGGSAPAFYMNDDYFNIVVQTDLLISSGVAYITLRDTRNQRYEVTLDSLGILTLYKSETMLTSVNISTTISNQWLTLRVSAIENTIRVFVNGNEALVFVDNETVIPAGFITIGGRNLDSFGLIIDNMNIQVAANEVLSTNSSDQYTPSENRAPKPVANNISPHIENPAFSERMSILGGDIAYESSADIFTMDGNGGLQTNQTAHWTPTSGDFQVQPDLSSTGDWVVFQSSDSGQQSVSYDLYAQYLVQPNIVCRLTNTPNINEEKPTWGPNNTDIAYSATVSGVSSIYRLAFSYSGNCLSAITSTGTLVAAGTSAAGAFSPDWSTNGIIYTVSAFSTIQILRVQSPFSTPPSSPTIVTDFTQMSNNSCQFCIADEASWEPNGTRIVYSSNIRNSNTTTRDLYWQEVTPTNPYIPFRATTDGELLSPTSNYDPYWTNNQGGVELVVYESSNGNIYRRELFSPGVPPVPLVAGGAQNPSTLPIISTTATSLADMPVGFNPSTYIQTTADQCTTAYSSNLQQKQHCWIHVSILNLIALLPSQSAFTHRVMLEALVEGEYRSTSDTPGVLDWGNEAVARQFYSTCGTNGCQGTDVYYFLDYFQSPLNDTFAADYTQVEYLRRRASEESSCGVGCIPYWSGLVNTLDSAVAIILNPSDLDWLNGVVAGQPIGYATLFDQSTTAANLATYQDCGLAVVTVEDPSSHVGNIFIGTIPSTDPAYGGSCY
jgi:Tol biopolymer transport system component